MSVSGDDGGKFADMCVWDYFFSNAMRCVVPSCEDLAEMDGDRVIKEARVWADKAAIIANAMILMKQENEETR